MFKICSEFEPKGDQPKAIEALTRGLLRGDRMQTLLGVTGSGKTFTMAHVVANIQKPTLVLSHNKTLAAQLYCEFKEFFPHNAVEYFVSYYDYYQPEAYIPNTDTYIEKDSSINEDIDRLRLRATSSILSRKDVLVVASVSAIYNLGSPEEYDDMLIFLKKGQAISRENLLERLVGIQYQRNDIDFKRGTFRVSGEVVEIFFAYEQTALRVELEYDNIGALSRFDPLTGKKIHDLESIAVYPAKHFVTSKPRIDKALVEIEREMYEQIRYFNAANKPLEAQRIEQRTRYDMEMMKELGYCSGIENYSRVLAGRQAGERPSCLFDYFKDGCLVMMDESHISLPQVRGMYHGDRSRKQTLVEYGFRLPSALDNRPLTIGEFERLLGQTIFVSATPGEYELKHSQALVEQVIRPTGLLDPVIEIRPSKGQIDDLIHEIRQRADLGQRTLVTTLTKRMAEELAKYLEDAGIAVKYIHSEIDAIERVELLRDLRLKKFDCLVGINLLREGIDLPEVSLVAVLDADKEGFLRSHTSLVQVVGRAARHVDGRAIFYADKISRAMRSTIDETSRRRRAQELYNKERGIKPTSIQKQIQEGIEAIKKSRQIELEAAGLSEEAADAVDTIQYLEKQMEEAAAVLDFEKAIRLRDQIRQLELKPEQKPESKQAKGRFRTYAKKRSQRS